MAIAVIALVILVIAPIALYFALIAPEEEPEIPSAVMSMSEIAHGFRFTIADVNGTILWANARISLFSSLVGTAVGWQSPSSSIPMISGVVWYGETIQFGGTNATLELTDAAGDGTIDVGDYFTVVAEPSGFAHGITYYLEIRAPSYVSSLDFVA
ncbi:MAG: hypothetical protein A3K67_03810 [Euryarchaeota archaeon RBG_16_62_10]|nr:MAG: hypothetical protein A3K67_03810 [Euryarchaeota archaeon RBG_16_62_10]